MIIISLIILIPALSVWLLMFILRDSDIDKKRLTQYAEGIVVGYEDGSRFTGLTVCFQWNGMSVCCGSEQVDRLEFPKDSKVSIYYHPDIMKQPPFSNTDRIIGIVHVNSPKYKELKQKSHKRTMYFMAVLATVLTLMAISILIIGILS